VGAVNVALLRELLHSENHHARAAATRLLRYWSDELPDAPEQLRQRAHDESGLVRLEAVNAASHIGTREALEAVLGVLDRPAGRHLPYAIRTSLGSGKITRLWQAREAGDPTAAKINAFFARYDETVAGYRTKGSVAPSDARGKADRKRGGQFGPLRSEEAGFDLQPNLAQVAIATVP